jgi:hypothetical protein
MNNHATLTRITGIMPMSGWLILALSRNALGQCTREKRFDQGFARRNLTSADDYRDQVLRP